MVAPSAGAPAVYEFAHAFEPLCFETLLAPLTEGDHASIATALGEVPGTAVGAFELRYVGALEGLLRSAWSGHEWIVVCHRRSVVESYGPLLCPGLGAEYLPDTEEVDALIRARAETEAWIPEGSRPAGLPDEWWWWDL